MNIKYSLGVYTHEFHEFRAVSYIVVCKTFPTISTNKFIIIMNGVQKKKKNLKVCSI